MLVAFSSDWTDMEKSLLTSKVQLLHTLISLISFAALVPDEMCCVWKQRAVHGLLLQAGKSLTNNFHWPEFILHRVILQTCSGPA